MSYSSLPLTSKLFQLTTLSLALALAGCGGDSVDSIAPAPGGDNGGGTGGNNGGTGGNNGNDGGVTTPEVEPDFFIQNLTVVPRNIELSDVETLFTVTVKAVQKVSGGAVANKSIILKVNDSKSNGITIEGQSVQTTDSEGNAVYKLKLNPQAVTDKAALLANGFTLIATAEKSGGGEPATQQLRVSVSNKGSGGGAQVIESKLDIGTQLTTSSVSNNVLNPYGDSAKLSITAKNENGARVKDVTVGLGIDNVKGISIIENNKVTDNNGVATFDIRVDENLSKAERDRLLQGVAYAISIKENSGATKNVLGNFTVAVPISDYQLDVQGMSSIINAYGDKQQLTITATAKNAQVPTTINGAQATIKLNNTIAGVTLSREALTLDANGQAVVDIIVAPTLSAAEREKLVQQKISYTITLSEPNRSVTTQTYANAAFIPQAQYQVKFASNSKNKLSSFGSSAVISFRVDDKSGGLISGQKVTVSLPKELSQKGLLILDSATTQTTDSTGVASYTVKIPTGLSAVQRAELEKLGGFMLTAFATEASGASSSISSQRIEVTAESETIVTAKSIPNAINVLKDQFQIQVAAKRPDGSAATNKKVKLVISNIAGISIQGNEQTTDASGNAVFRVNLSQDLSQAQRQALVKSGIPYSVTLTDDDGIATNDYTASVILPVAEYQLNFENSSKAKLLSTGDSTVISFRVNDKDGGVIANQKVTASLPDTLTQKGLMTLESAANQVTDDQGRVSYTVSIPAGLSALQRAELEEFGGFVLNTRLIEASGASIDISSQRVPITADPGRSKTVLTTKSIPSIVNVLKDQFQIQVAGKRPSGSAASGKSVKLVINNVQGVSIVGGEQMTNAAGTAVFTVNIDPSLSLVQRQELAKTGISYTAILTDEDGIATENYNAQAAVPNAEYEINFGTISTAQLSSSGGSTVISFRVNDKDGGVIANQKVTASLPRTLISAGLLTLDSAAAQVTDSRGMVNYTVRVPAGLSAAQRAVLEKENGFALMARMTEESGVSSSVSSERVRISNEVQKSATVLNSKSIPSVVSVLKDQFQIQVSGKRPNGSAAANRVINLVISDVNGVSIEGNEKTTDASGNAIFTVNLDQSLTQAQREALVKSGIAYSAILTDEDGIVTSTYNAPVAIPTAEYKINFGTASSTQLSSFGGSAVISFRVNDTSGGIITNQRVTAVLPKALTEAGLLTLDGATTQVTDTDGMVRYTVRVPAGLNKEDRDKLVGNFVLTTALIEASGASSTGVSAPISFSNEVQKSETTLSSKSIPSVVNVLKDQFQIQVSGKRANGSAAADKIMKLNIDGVSGVSVENNERTTDAAGNAVFTVNIDKNLTLKQRKALAASGIAYTATITDDDGIATQKYTALAAVPVAEYKINLGTVSNTQLSSSGGSTVISFRVNDVNGGIVANQKVTAVLPKALTDAGLLTLDSAATQVTDTNGMVSYTVRIPAGLTKAQSDALEAENGFVLTTATIETSGASSTAQSARISVKAEPGKSDTVITSKTIPGVVNVLKNQFKVQISAKRPDGAAAIDKAVRLIIEGVPGVSIEGSEQATDTAGNAVFTVNIDSSLTRTQREAIAASGITYTAVLTDDDGITTQKYTASATIPASEYRINFGIASSTQLSSFGGNTVISFRVNDADGGIVANQRVSAVIPKELTDAGLLTLDSAATQVTDDKGIISYTVRVPAGLDETKRAKLEAAGSFVLTTALIEASGASSTGVSAPISFSNEVQKSATTLTAKSIPSAVNIFKEQFQIQVLAKRPNGGVAANKVVKLIIDGVPGVSIEGNEQTTNAAGNAVFTVNLSQDLTPQQRDSLVNNGFTYTAILTDDDGIATLKDQTVNVIRPAAEYQINAGTVSNAQLSSSGGSTVISFRVNDNKGGVIAKQNITAKLPQQLIDAGLLTLDSAANQVTDTNGMARYTVRVPAGLNATQKAALEAAGNFKLSAVLTEDSGATTQVESGAVTISDAVAVSDTVLTAKSIPSAINIFKEQFQIQVLAKRPNGGVAANKVVKLIIDGVPGISIEGNEQTTNAAGNAVFTVNLSQDLTPQQRDSLVNNGFTYTAILTDDDGIATLKDQTVNVIRPAAEYQINAGTVSNAQLSSSGGSTVISFRVNDNKGGVIAKQNITAKLPQQLIDAGLLTLDSAANQVTDTNGMARYTVRVPAGLNATQKAALEAAGNFKLSAVLTEDSGATTQVESGAVTISDAVAVSDTVLTAKSIPSAINIFKEQFQIQVLAKRPNGGVAANKVVKLIIDGVPGVSIEGNEQTTNAAGNAVFTVNLSQDLTPQQRDSLVNNGFTYTAILTDDDGIATLKDQKVNVIRPAAEYQINFNPGNKETVSVFGGTTILSFRVNDASGGAIANQTVTASLPKELTDAGLLTLDGNTAKVTNDKGVVNYLVRVPAGLTQEQRNALEAAGNFKLTAVLTEDSGATTQVESERVSFITVSETRLSSKSIPGIVNVLKDQFQIQISSKRPDGGVAANKVVELIINGTPGISVEGSEQTTNADGNATFTVNIDKGLSLAQRDAIAASGITYTAILRDDDGVATIENVTAEAQRPAAQYQINFGTSSKTQLSSSGGSTVISFRVSDKKGGGIDKQKVIASLPNNLVEQGLLTIEGDSEAETNNNGMVSYIVRVPAGLNATQKGILEAANGFVLNAEVTETSGATSKAISESIALSSEVQKSETTLTSKSVPGIVNVLKDQFQIQVTGKRPNNGIAANKVVKLIIDGVPGLSIADNEQTTDAAGIATFTVTIDPSLTLAQREALVTSGIAYKAILTDEDGIATIENTAQATIPAPEYQINFGTSSKVQLSSSGGSTVISFRVDDKKGGGADKQTVIASLPSKLVEQGLLTIEGNAQKQTNAEGIVSYTVSVPAGLSPSQKSALEAAGAFKLTAKAIETSGASSVVSSSAINIGSAIGLSDIKLTSTSNPKVVTVTDSQFTIQVSAKRPDSSAAVGNNVKLIITQTPGVTIQGNEQTTDAAGNAVFTVNLSQDLTEQQRNDLVASGITYTAMITDDDGTEATLKNQKVEVVQPATSISFDSILTPSISELGGSGSVIVRLQTKGANPQAVKGQAVAIQLGKKALDYGVSVNKASATTDFKGEATFVIDIPEGLTVDQRNELKGVGINYQLSYVEKDITYDSGAQKVDITTPAVDLTVLNAPNLINNRPFYTLNGEGDTTVINARLSTRETSFNIAGQPIELTFADKDLAALLIVNGKLGSATNIVSTGTNGTSNFTVIVPSNLTPAQKDKLQNKRLTATLKETLTGKTQEIQFNIQSTKAAIDLIAVPPAPLNLNGGETQIEVIAQDSKDNVIEGQKVFLALPAAIAAQGVILTTSGTQTTNDSGKAIFTLAVPADLTQAQKDAIGSSFKVALTAADANGNIATNTSTITTVTPAANGTQENITIGANKVVNTKGDTFKVFVQVANDGRAINGRTVRLNVDEPIKTGVTVANGTATTNSDGVATFDLKLEPGANVNQALLESGILLTATTTTAENTELKQNYIVAVDTATIDSYQILATSDKSTLNTGGDQTNATFRVTDSSGGILVGVPVQLSIENLEASGAALTTASVVTTDATGKVDVGVLLAANTVNARLNHSVVINAKIVTPTYDANGNVNMAVREEKSLSLSANGTVITLAASVTQLKDGETTTISTTLIDGAGRAIANAGMELVDASGNAITTNTITDADGKASFNINEASLTFDDNGNLRVFARALGEGSLVTQRSISSIDLVKVSQAGISFIDIVDVYDVNVPQNINVQIRTDSPAQANALIGKQVELQTSIGTFDNNNVITTKTINASNINGNIITVPVQLTSELAGTTVLQATVLGEMTNGKLKYRTTVDTRFRATTPAKMLFQAVKSVITPGSSTEIVATVKDKNDVPVEGQTVVFSRSADSSAGRLSAATAVTDSKGEARVVYLANASSPIGGVVINARLLIDNAGIGIKTTNITVSKEAVYTTLAFGDTLSSDDIYYTVQGSISVMDGSGRAVPNKEVSIKSYAIEYAQGKVCALNSTITYQGATTVNADTGEQTTPTPQSFSEQSPVTIKSNWIASEDDPEYNYTLDKDDDVNGNNSLDAINPVAIIGGTVSDDGYTFVTNDEGRADFRIRYPKRYSNWVKVRFDSTTFLNGSENLQSINYQLPTETGDISIDSGVLMSPWTDDTSPFGNGGATCVNTLSVNIDENKNSTSVQLLSDSENRESYSVSINNQSMTDTGVNHPFYSVDFSEAFRLGSIVRVSNSGTSFTKVLKVE